MVNCPTWITDCDSHSPTLLELFLSFDLCICFGVVPPHWEILIIFLPCFPVNSCQTRRGELYFITQLLLNLMLIEMVFAIFYEKFQGMIYLDFMLLLLILNFVSKSRLELMYFLPWCKYQGKPHSSPWLSTVSVAAIANRNYIFFCTNKINLVSKVTEVRNCYKRVLEVCLCL